jgi:predicted Zn-dependent protease
MAKARLWTALALGTVLVAAPVPTVSKPREIRTVDTISAADRAQGAKAHPDLLAEFGGLYQGPQAAYVTQVGRRIAVQSSLSNQQGDFTISLLNSPVNNAFAIPGGYVYVTRQLMALMNDEAELAGVLGHEIGHVAARHSQRRQSAAQRNSILGALGQVLVGAVAGDSGLGQLLQRGIGTGAQLLTLKFSRTQEYEADDLGIRYLARAGYDPTALSSVLASLAAQNALDARLRGSGGSVPEWASTHPDPGARVKRALAAATATGSTATLRNRDVYLAQLDGLLYDDDPARGVVDKGRFLHPTLKLGFAAPQGFAISNAADAVTVSGSGGQARFSGAPYAGNLDDYVMAVFRKLAGNGSLGQIDIRRTTINALPVAFAGARASSQSGQPLDISVYAYEFGPRTAYHFLLVTPAGQGVGPFDPMLRSLAPLTPAQVAAIRPRRIALVTVRKGDTAASLAARMAYDDAPLDRFRVLNGLAANAEPQVGQRVKLVVAAD